MNFANIPSHASVFVDTNILVYHFISHSTFGAACTEFLERIERGDLDGFTSSHVLGEVMHRLMTLEACSRFSWPKQGIARRLRNHSADIRKLKNHRMAIDEITLLGTNIHSVAGTQISLAADVSVQHGLLMNDALIVTVMQNNGLSLLASNDGDFDRVPGITRCMPN